MRKPRTIILVFIVFALVPGLLLLYVYCMPSIKGIININPNDEFSKGAFLNLQTEQIQVAQSQEGTRLDGFGYTITLKEYKNYIDKSLDKSMSRTYVDDKKRMVLLISPDYYTHSSTSTQFMKDIIYTSDKATKQIDAAAGKHLETEYDCYNAIYSASIKNVSLLNNEKNEGLVQLLNYKAGSASGSIQAIYKFDNEFVKGFMLIGNTSNGIIARVIIFRQANLNKEYYINFVGKFTPEEVDAAISTITFDPE